MWAIGVAPCWRAWVQPTPLAAVQGLQPYGLVLVAVVDAVQSWAVLTGEQGVLAGDFAPRAHVTLRKKTPVWPWTWRAVWVLMLPWGRWRAMVLLRSVSRAWRKKTMPLCSSGCGVTADVTTG